MTRANSKRLFDRGGLAALAKPLRFVGLSGLGWIIDTSVYMLLVSGAGLRVFVAGMIGGLCGASFAFLTSSRLVFSNRRDGLGRRLLVYLLYTVVQIIIAAALIDMLAVALQAAVTHFGIAVPWPAIAFLAKCIITPFLLAMNYVVARRLNTAA
ncbi:MAG: hypothetical protein HC900_01845 [Methylacidiphilales bacterium]|nr:hypothetical protein [Candidatus Methylacidiphilales bacterium]